MSLARIFADLRFFFVAALLGTGIAAMVAPSAALGFALGVVGTGLNFLGLWSITWLLKQSTFSTKARKWWAAGAVTLFFITLPLMVALMYYVYALKGVAPGGFLWGLALVYCWAVGWAESTKK